MAYTLLNTVTASPTSTSTPTITVPSTTAGSFLILTIHQYQPSGHSAAGFSAPTHWVNIEGFGSSDFADSQLALAAAYYPNNIGGITTIGLSSAVVGDWFIVYEEWGGDIAGSTPTVDVKASGGPATNTSLEVFSGTRSGATDLLFSMAAGDGSGFSFTYSDTTGWTETADTSVSLCYATPSNTTSKGIQFNGNVVFGTYVMIAVTIAFTPPSAIVRSQTTTETPATTVSRSQTLTRAVSTSVTPLMSVEGDVGGHRTGHSTVDPVVSVQANFGVHERTGHSTITPSTTIPAVTGGRAQRTQITPTTALSREVNGIIELATHITASASVSSLKIVPRSQESTTSIANTVRIHIQPRRALQTSVQPQTLLSRSGVFHRFVGMTATIETTVQGTVIKYRFGATTETPSTTVSRAFHGARFPKTTITPYNLVTAILTFGPTPAGALRSFLPVHIWDGDQLIFSGWISRMDARSLAPNHQEVDITAQSLYFLAQTCFPAEVLEQMPIGQMIQMLVAYNLPGATLSELASGPIDPYAVYETSSLDTIFRDLLAAAISVNVPGVLDFDKNFALRLAFNGSFPQAPVELTDGQVLHGGVYP